MKKSDVRKCGKCDNEFQLERGCISLSFYIATGKGEEFEGWSSVDLCPDCSSLARALTGRHLGVYKWGRPVVKRYRARDVSRLGAL